MAGELTIKDLREPITLAQMAKAIRIRWHVLRRAAESGKIRAVKLGGHWLCDGADIPHLRDEAGTLFPHATRVFAVNERLVDLGVTPRKGRKPKKKKQAKKK